MVLINPPFGKKSSVTIVNEAGDEEKQSLVVHRDDFWASTSNKQLNFLQHVFTILKQHGRAAIVVPDNDSHMSLSSLRTQRRPILHCCVLDLAELRDVTSALVCARLTTSMQLIRLYGLHAKHPRMD